MAASPPPRAPTAPAIPVSAIINNERTGANWGNGGGWNDATANAYPDWVQINFNGSKTIDHVVVYTVQDNYANPVEPTDTMTFSLYGITDFTVQGWNGSAWVTLGTVSGNNLVKRTVNFAAYTTDRIRINVTDALASYSRITEVEAWGTGAVGPVTDDDDAGELAQSVDGRHQRHLHRHGHRQQSDRQRQLQGRRQLDQRLLRRSPWLAAATASTAACSTSALTVGTHSIIASLRGDAGNRGVDQRGAVAGRQRRSAAASTSRSPAMAASPAPRAPTAPAIPVSAIINNERTGANWGNGGGWNDATANTYPDWVQINFNGSKTIDHVVVYTVQDNYANPVEPTDTMTFSLYGITDFTVQGWNGSTWVTLGTVSGNNLVKRTVNFAAYTTDRIRINVTAALASYSRITEVEAWGH